MECLALFVVGVGDLGGGCEASGWKVGVVFGLCFGGMFLGGRRRGGGRVEGYLD